jgi:hypothetical protein
MKLSVTQKGNKMFAYKWEDKNTHIYTMAKKGILGNSRIELFNKMGYSLYSLKQDLKGRHAYFEVYENEKLMIKATCTATFLNPSIAVKYYSYTYILRSTDRVKFLVIKDKEEIGTIKVFEDLKGNLQFDLDIHDDQFEDFMLLFVQMIYSSFFNK